MIWNGPIRQGKDQGVNLDNMPDPRIIDLAISMIYSTILEVQNCYNLDAFWLGACVGHAGRIVYEQVFGNANTGVVSKNDDI
ncbi:hypothetical protein AGMMS49992_33620 [Clostridia bacterium]|nr:hypothetical protein AGMMS49992_33620 [Clostridia bacterium]